MQTDNCWIYKGSKREEMYLYLPGDGDFSAVPEALVEAMGELTLVMSLRLHSERHLARADVTRVMSDLEKQGFYLQMPPAAEPELT